jgi:hypothetical protein
VDNNYQFINYHHGSSFINWVNNGTYPLKEIILSKTIHDKFIGPWDDLKIHLDNFVFNDFNYEKIVQWTQSFIKKPSIFTLQNNCDVSSIFILNRTLLKDFIVGGTVLRYFFIFLAVWNLIKVVKDYNSMSNLFLILYKDEIEKDSLDTIIEPPKKTQKKLCKSFLKLWQRQEANLKKILEVPRIIILLFSPYFFLVAKSDEDIKTLDKINEKYEIFKKNFITNDNIFFYQYVVHLIRIGLGLPMTLSFIIVNIDLLGQEYSVGLLLSVLFSCFSLFLSIFTPCVLKSFDNNPGVLLLRFYFLLLQLIGLSIILNAIKG